YTPLSRACFRNAFRCSTVRPRYSASASVWARAICLPTSSTTAALSFRLRLKVYSSQYAPRPLCEADGARLQRPGLPERPAAASTATTKEPIRSGPPSALALSRPCLAARRSRNYGALRSAPPAVFDDARSPAGDHAPPSCVPAVGCTAGDTHDICPFCHQAASDAVSTRTPTPMVDDTASLRR